MKIRNLFVHHPDGSWEPRQSVRIQTDQGSIEMNPGTRFRRGILFMGLDVAKLCDEDADA